MLDDAKIKNSNIKVQTKNYGYRLLKEEDPIKVETYKKLERDFNPRKQKKLEKYLQKVAVEKAAINKDKK